MITQLYKTSLALGLALVSIGVTESLADNDVGDVLTQSKISSTAGGFSGELEHGDRFGAATAAADDLSGDGIADFLVGAPGDDAGGGAGDRGAVWLLFMDGDASVLAEQKISDVDGGFFGLLRDGDAFGSSVLSLGDLDGDARSELAVGAVGDDDGALNAGAVWTIFLDTDGSVRTQQKISNVGGGFSGGLDRDDRFGSALASLGDLDGDSIEDIAVGAPGDDDGGVDRGAVWILFLNENGTVKSHQKISSTSGAFAGPLGNGSGFGSSVDSIGDIDGDGVPDLAIGASGDDDGGVDRGAVWILFLNENGTAKSHQKISSTEGGFAGSLPNGARFGNSLAHLADVNGDSVRDLAVGSDRDPDGGINRGACWVLFLNSDGWVNREQKISSQSGSFFGPLDDGDFFGRGLSAPNSSGDGSAIEVWVGARGDDDGGSDRGAVWVLGLVGSSTTSAPERRFDSVLVQEISPNPAQSQTELVFRLTQPSLVDISIVAATGRRITSLPAGTLAAGTHRISWGLDDRSGTRVPSGLYFVNARVNGRESVQRVTVVR